MAAHARRLGRLPTARIAHPPRRLPSQMLLWINILRWFVVRPLVERNPEQFAGVLAIWEDEEANIATRLESRAS